MRFSISLFALCTSTLVACGGAAPDEDDADSTASSVTTASEQVVTFESDGKVRGPDVIFPGYVKVRYAKNRAICPVASHLLSEPPGSTIHWEGTAMLDTPFGGPKHGMPIVDLGFDGAKPYGEGTVYVHAQATRLSLWFSRVKADGNTDCWDSNGGRNYVFNVAPPAVITFNRDGSVSGPPSLKVGRVVAVRFDLMRSVCRPQDALPGRERQVWLTVDNGTPQRVVTRVGPAASGIAVGEFLVPKGKKIGLWSWMASKTGNCWDSNGGKNFVFPIED